MLHDAIEAPRRTQVGLRLLLHGLAVAIFLASPVGADDEIDRILAQSGEKRYEEHCTPCHGEGGAPGKVNVDLRTYVARHGGEFPTSEWLEVLQDLGPGPHTEVWDDIRKREVSAGGVGDPLAARAVIAKIARYIMSIQQPE